MTFLNTTEPNTTFDSNTGNFLTDQLQSQSSFVSRTAGKAT